MNGADELLTPRLRLRLWREQDGKGLVAINRDPEVTRFLNSPVDEAATEAFLGKTVRHWEEHGFGHFALEARDGPLAGRLVGFVGVAYPTFMPPLADRPELGWRLAPDAWGQGLATEAALAARDDAFDRLGLPELISIIHPENVRSRRVARKVGMRVEGRVHNDLYGRDVELWSLSSRIR